MPRKSAFSRFTFGDEEWNQEQEWSSYRSETVGSCDLWTISQPVHFVTVNRWKIHRRRISRTHLSVNWRRFLAGRAAEQVTDANYCGSTSYAPSSLHRSGGISNERTEAPSLASSPPLSPFPTSFLCPPATVVMRRSTKSPTIINRRVRNTAIPVNVLYTSLFATIGSR